MSAKKLQVEVDKHFRKVDESVQAYDELWNELFEYNSPDPEARLNDDGGKREQLKRKKQCKKFTTQEARDLRKEKITQDLEREIKKLHRFGDQLKTWLRDSSIKDKDSLNEYKKKVEVRYKRGKEFYKDGVSSEPKDDEPDGEYEDMCKFLHDALDTLRTQIDSMELELLKDKAGERAAALLALIETSRWHISTIEKLLRLLRNGAITVETLENCKDGLEYYVEHNQDADFYGADMGLYDDLGLDGLEMVKEPPPEPEPEVEEKPAPVPKKEKETRKETKREEPKRERDRDRKRKERDREKREEAKSKQPEPVQEAPALNGAAFPPPAATFARGSSTGSPKAPAATPTSRRPPPPPVADEPPAPSPNSGPKDPLAITSHMPEKGKRSPAVLILALVSAGVSQDSARQAWRSGADLEALLEVALAKATSAKNAAAAAGGAGKPQTPPAPTQPQPKEAPKPKAPAPSEPAPTLDSGRDDTPAQSPTARDASPRDASTSRHGGLKSSAPDGDPNAETAVIWMDYEARDRATEISVKRGDRIAVVRRERSGWTLVRVGGREGWIPDAYTRPKEAANYAHHEIVQVVQDFRVVQGHPLERSMLALAKGDQVHVVTTENGWAYGYVRAQAYRQGWFPNSLQM